MTHSCALFQFTLLLKWDCNENQEEFSKSQKITLLPECTLHHHNVKSSRQKTENIKEHQEYEWNFNFYNIYQCFPSWGSTLLWRGCRAVGQSSILNEATTWMLHWKRSRTRMGRERGWNQSSDRSSQSSGAEDGGWFFWGKQKIQILAVNYEEVVTVRCWRVEDIWDSFEGRPQGTRLIWSENDRYQHCKSWRERMEFA